MRKPKILRFRRRKKPSPEAVGAFARAYYQLEEERRDAASGSIDALIQKTPTEKLPELVEDPSLRTIGAIGYLGGVFNDLLATDPKHATTPTIWPPGPKRSGSSTARTSSGTAGRWGTTPGRRA